MITSAVTKRLPPFEVSKVKLRTGEFILGICVILLAAYVLVIITDFPDFTLRGKKLPGPRFFPMLLSLFLIGFGSFFIVTSFRTRSNSSLREGVISFEGILNCFVILLSVLIFMPLCNLLGTTFTIVFLGSVIMVFLGIKWYASILYSLLLGLLARVIFVDFFKVALPVGMLFKIFK